MEHVGCMVAKESEIPTVEDIAQRFRNLKMQQTEVPEPDVHPEFTARLQRTIDEKIERELQRNRSEVAITNVLERSVNQPQRDPDVKMLSLGVGPQNLISKENENKIKEYGEKHFSIRAIPDQKEMNRLAPYVSNISQSSASSLEIAREAMMTRRVEGASGSALSETGKRGRRQKSKKLPKRRRKQ